MLARRLDGFNSAELPGVLAMATFESYSSMSPSAEVREALEKAKQIMQAKASSRR